MRVCVVGKYPPIQGGISAQCYWMCRRLADAGHEIDVVTNADEVEGPFRLRLDENDLDLGSRQGAVRVWRTEAPTAAYRHIPQTNPVVTKLTSLALEAIEGHRSELVVGFYLEPYVVAAYLAATLSGRPLVVRHAGSDVGRLLLVPQLGPTYAAILKSATMVLTRRAAHKRFLALGLPESRIVADPEWAPPRELFHPAVEPLDVKGYLAELGLDAVDPSHPVIGVYGKMGEAKGTFDLLDSLIRLNRDGIRFTLLAATHGSADDQARFARTIADGGLTACVRQVPFLAHQRVPSFLRACALVCVLEREFPIAAHSPVTPLEVLACGTPLLVSAEIARKQEFAPRLVHGRNVLVVRDPRDHDELGRRLRGALDDLEATSVLGRRGARLVAEVVAAPERTPYEDLFAAVIESRGGPLEHPSAESRDGGPPDDEEERLWAELQRPHPTVACTQVLDDLFYRELETSAPGPTAVPALATNVVIRLFSRCMDADGDVAPCGYAFQHLPFRDRTRVVRLGLGHYLLLSFVNGDRSLQAIAAAIDPNGAGVVENVCAGARDLFDEGIIVFSTREGAHSES